VEPVWRLDDLVLDLQNLDLGRLVDVRHRLHKDVLTAAGLSTQSVSELAEETTRSLEGTMWTVIQVDDEGFESESI